MRFVTAHKMATYLMAASAFGALALSGLLSPFALVLGALVLPASWFAEAPRVPVKKLLPVLNAVAAVALAAEIVRALASGDVLLSGARFLLVLLAIKLLSRRTNKDYQHIYVLTFLMLVSGTVLNPGVTFGISFLIYVIAATWALILFHLRRDMEDNLLIRHDLDHGAEPVEIPRILNSRRIVSKSFLLGTSLVSLSIFAVASLLFFSIPRIGFGLFYEGDRSSLQMAGFSDRVELGGHGTIRDDPTVVMRVVLEEGAPLEALPPLRFRGVAFDFYEDGRWKRSDDAPGVEGRVSRRPGISRLRLGFGGRAQGSGNGDALENALRQEIYLEPLGYDVLFGASLPLVYELEGTSEALRPERNDEVRYPHGSGVAYTVYSDVERPSADELRAAEPALPDGYEAYLQLPDDLPPRVENLAEEITQGAETNYDKIVAIERWLADLDYTREMTSPGAHEPLEHFLFERRKGHCEYFASALAVLARAAGVPTRNVNGFLGGEWNDIADYLAVRAGDAHSWVEVYFHGVGWVTFDPTPASGTPSVTRGEGGLLSSARRFADSLRFQWFQWVVEYDLHRQLRVFRGVADAFRGGADAAIATPLDRVRSWLPKPGKGALAGLTLAAAGLATLWIWKRWRPGRRGRARAAARGRKGVAASYEAALRKLSRRGYKRPSSATPREHAAQLRARRAPGAEAFAELAELYYDAEYGGREEERSRARAAHLEAAVARALREAARGAAERSS